MNIAWLPGIVGVLVVIGAAVGGGYTVAQTAPASAAAETVEPEPILVEPTVAVPDQTKSKADTACEEHCQVMRQTFVHVSPYGCVCADVLGRPVNYMAGK